MYKSLWIENYCEREENTSLPEVGSAPVKEREKKNGTGEARSQCISDWGVLARPAGCPQAKVTFRKSSTLGEAMALSAAELSHKLVASQGKDGLVDPKKHRQSLSATCCPCSGWSSGCEWSPCMAAPSLTPGLCVSLGDIGPFQARHDSPIQSATASFLLSLCSCLILPCIHKIPARINWNCMISHSYTESLQSLNKIQNFHFILKWLHYCSKDDTIYIVKTSDP